MPRNGRVRGRDDDVCVRPWLIPITRVWPIWRTPRCTIAQCDGSSGNHRHRCRRPVEQELKDAKLSPSDIDEVVLVGGSTRVPKVQQVVKEIFGKDDAKKAIALEYIRINTKND